MGALVAGVAIASFPYHADIAAKISSLRDFFITLFFVGLGLQIPIPTKDVVLLAGAIGAFVLVSRMITVFPVLYLLKYGNRASLIPSLNLSQLSEFSLVLASLGVTYGHVTPDLLSAFILAMVSTALISSFTIPNSHSIYRTLSPLLNRIGFKDHLSDAATDCVDSNTKPQIVMLGFYRARNQMPVRRHQPSRYSSHA